MLSSMHLNAMVLFKLSRTKDVQKYWLGKHLWGLFMVLPCRDYHKSSIMKTNLHSQHERKVVKVVKPVDARTKVVFKFTFFLFGDDHKSTSTTTNEPTNYLVTSRQPILTVWIIVPILILLPSLGVCFFCRLCRCTLFPHPSGWALLRASGSFAERSPAQSFEHFRWESNTDSDDAMKWNLPVSLRRCKRLFSFVCVQYSW